ncbi:hypothetical protein [Sphingobium sp. D43FB]|uniref:hypothetical protein n=1 Tax=Sphingobium sp. D43FB TaxID=2017595 RepID=UPI000BB5571A|nr:hypothetical protein [Sphingobium sp. D43FB]PBN44648.1 hypothetical protein SxD43FB_05640 [Sphingobium sp. D43FB]
MTIFTVIRQPGTNNDLAGAVAEHFASTNYRLNDESWLIATTGTARQVSDILGLSDGSRASGVVIEVASYFGYANPAIWTWIKNNWTTPPNG